MKATLMPFLVATSLTLSTAHGAVFSTDFETGTYSPWTNRGTASTRAVQLIPGYTGANTQALRIDGRSGTSANQAGVELGIGTAATLNNAAYSSGHTFSFRFRVKVDAYASVRAMLQWVSGGVAQAQVILAERVVFTPGQWVEIRGSQKLTWTGAQGGLTRVYFEVEQYQRTSTVPAQSRYPGYWIDDVVMDLDDDGDTLSNAEELARLPQPTSISNADSDTDRMTDDWEIEQGLDPNVNDANADDDADGFTNVQEFFAGTLAKGAGAALSFPGKTADGSATFATRALLRYLALRPVAQRVLVGQMISDNTVDFASYWSPLALPQNGGRMPAIMSLAVEGGQTPVDIAASVDNAIPHAQAGGVVLIKWAVWNPWRAHIGYVNGQLQGNMGDQNAVDINALLDASLDAPINTPAPAPPVGVSADNTTARRILDSWLDTVAAELKRFSTATGGVPVLFRPMSEMNGAWFWWGHRTREEYLALWDHIRDRLTNDEPNGHGLHNLLWVYESVSSEHYPQSFGFTATSSDYYVPPADRVDAVTHNLYDDDWVMPFDADRVYARYGKVYGVPQAGPSVTNSRDHTWDNLTYLETISTKYPHMSFFITWNGFDSHDDDDNNPSTPSTDDDGVAGTDTPSHKYLPLVENAHVVELMNDQHAHAKQAVTLDELRWQAPTALTAAATGATQAALAWSGVPGETGYRVERSADGATGWTLQADTAADMSSLNATALGVASQNWFRVRALYGAEDSLPTDGVPITTWTQLQQWKSNTLGSTSADTLGDDEHDGICNLMEYALALNPMATDVAGLPVVASTTVGNVDYPSITFTRNLNAPEVTMTVQVSSDLVNWQDGSSFSAAGDVPTNAHTTLVSRVAGIASEVITVRCNVPMAAGSPCFLRVKAGTP